MEAVWERFFKYSSYSEDIINKLSLDIDKKVMGGERYMKKIIRYLKPFAGSVAVAVILVFVQAMCDLKLPDYMSNIVNVGIQQGGIADAVPEKIRAEEAEAIFVPV